MAWTPYFGSVFPQSQGGQGQPGQQSPFAPGYLDDSRVPQSIRDQAESALQAQQQLQSIGPHTSALATALQGVGSFMAGRSEADANERAVPFLPAPSSQPNNSLLASLLRGGAPDPSSPMQLAGAVPGSDDGSGSGLMGAIGRKSDRRLKSDVVRVGTLKRTGLPLYAYRLEDSPLFEVGCMADEVALIRPEATWFDPADGFARVDYSRIL